MRDRTRGVLLTLIAVALWGLLLRPVLTPVPTKADDALGQKPTLVVTDQGVYVATQLGHVFLLDRVSLAVKARAMYTLDSLQYPTFRTGQR